MPGLFAHMGRCGGSLPGRHYWRVIHSRQVDDLLVELIELLISIRYTHPTMVQLEMILESEEP